MTTLDGTWSFVAQTPMGDRCGTITASTDAERLTGKVSGDFGDVEISDGAVIDGEARWSMYVQQPMPITIRCAVRVTGDDLHGTVTVDRLGSFPLQGSRTP